MGDLGPTRFKEVRYGKKKGRFFLILIDIFSKKIFAKALYGKTSTSVLKAFEEIKSELKKPYVTPDILETDLGSEFFSDNQIRFKGASGSHKARSAERAIRTFKRILIPF